MSIRTTAALIAAGLTALTLSACDPATAADEPSDPTTRRVSAPTWTPTTSVAPVVKVVDPYSTTGMWRVPQDIAPGTYQATTTSTGYWKLCRTAACEIGTDGFIDNDLYQTQTYLTIPADAAYVEIKNTTLTPAN
ncbi:hypothetical protein [Nocardia carnea]|uniref:hypothetical protein n=1 Tax=Nocardia carnea TaxID=37328 RepID=UPI002455983D|nr:hypothetical protein [Nocardia carnea]